MKQNKRMVDLAKKPIHDKKVKRKFKWPSFTTWLMIGFTIITLNYAYETYQLHKLRQDLQQEMKLLQEKNQQLEEEKKKLQSQEELEKVARSQLGMVKPGEVPYVK